MENSKKDTNAISVLEIIGLLWSHKYFIFICALIVCVVMFIRVEYFTSPTYTSQAALYVTNYNADQQTTSGRNASTINKSDIDSSRTLTSTYIEILQTRSFFSDVSDKLNKKYGWGQIKGMTSIRSVNETELLSISVTSLNPDTSYEVLNAIIDVAPTRLENIIKRGEVMVVDTPSYPSGPNKKSAQKSGMIGFLVGFIIGCVIIYFINIFDNKIHKDAELVARYDINVLGTIAQERLAPDEEIQLINKERARGRI